MVALLEFGDIFTGNFCRSKSAEAISRLHKIILTGSFGLTPLFQFTIPSCNRFVPHSNECCQRLFQLRGSPIPIHRQRLIHRHPHHCRSQIPFRKPRNRPPRSNRSLRACLPVQSTKLSSHMNFSKRNGCSHNCAFVRSNHGRMSGRAITCRHGDFGHGRSVIKCCQGGSARIDLGRGESKYC